jgi:ribosome-associated heat shock protein Hsp15
MAADGRTDDPSDQARLRIDRWLWFARFFKSRNAASQVCNARRIRIAGKIVAKASHMVKVGDILTFPQARTIRTIKIVELGTRRGPAPEAQMLYEDMEPATPDQTPTNSGTGPGTRTVKGSGLLEASPAKRSPGSGRPTKSQRRALDRLRDDV